ncbi:MAG: hypothetical protein IK127_09345 [Clostridia bacterium]|nr:hypothetical protein [Clostridia bacterium]
MNYVGENKLFTWYHTVAKPPRLSDAALLAEVHQQCVEFHAEEYVLPPEKTLSGREERYAYRSENIGACGASTGFMYF